MLSHLFHLVIVISFVIRHLSFVIRHSSFRTERCVVLFR